MSNTNGDYISREYLLNEYDKRHKGPPGGARKLIEEVPPADVRPVVRGEWIKRDPSNELDGDYYCSACGDGIDIADGSITPLDVDLKFCPNCGADMRPEPEPPKDHPAPICQTCGNFEICPWRHEGIFSGPKDKTRRVVACSDYKDKKG